MSIRDADRKVLWGRSGNMCAFPGCRVELAPHETGNRVMGEEAHIKGEKPGAARFDPGQSPEERDSYDNLILLCRNHHLETDACSVEQLLQMKAEHEELVKRSRLYPEVMGALTRTVMEYSGVKRRWHVYHP